MRWISVFVLTVLLTISTVAQPASPGVQTLVGQVDYTVSFLQDFGAASVTVLLVDRSEFVDQATRVDRLPDPDYQLPLSGQHMGQVMTDPLQSPFEYQVALPVTPQAQLRDVDNDAQADPGVAVMHVDVVVDMFGDTYWDTQREYSAGFTSTRRSRAFDRRYEIIGGKLIIWAPDDAQAFPAGFGGDGLLFTPDDPIAAVEPGYTVVDLDTAPFTFIREPQAQVDLIEREQALQPADYRMLSYADAFDALIDQMRREYAFTDLKNVDWDGLYSEFAPRFAQATAENDPYAYQWALQEFIWSIPDGHINATLPRTDTLYLQATDGGIGLSLVELDDGRVIVSYVSANSPAVDAGIVPGAEVVMLNGEPIVDALNDVVVWSGPFSSEHSRHLQQVRYITRFPVGEQVVLAFVPPNETEPQSVTMTAIPERDSWDFSSINLGAADVGALPVEFRILPDGYGYVRVNTFADDPILLLRLWEWMIDTLNAEGIPGLVIDMRWNSGGYNLYHQMAAYFFNEPLLIGNIARYYDGIDAFYVDPIQVERLLIPPDGRYYDRPVAVIVSPACASACEYFAHNMTLDDRAAIVGHYPSDGLGGSVTPVFLPDNVYFQFTISRALTADGEIRIEGEGVAPTIHVPVTEETVFATDDVLLAVAIDYLDATGRSNIVDGGVLTVGEHVGGMLSVGERVRYQFTVPVDGTYDVMLSDTSGTLDTVLNIYLDADADPVLSNDDDPRGGTPNSALVGVELNAGVTLVIEVAGFEDSVSGDFQLVIIADESG